MFRLLRWSGCEDVLHAGYLRGEEEDLIEDSSWPEATVEPHEQLQTKREGHDPEADHPHCPHHRHLPHNKAEFKNQTCSTIHTFLSLNILLNETFGLLSYIIIIFIEVYMQLNGQLSLCIVLKHIHSFIVL